MVMDLDFDTRSGARRPPRDYYRPTEPKGAFEGAVTKEEQGYTPEVGVDVVAKEPVGGPAAPPEPEPSTTPKQDEPSPPKVGTGSGGGERGPAPRATPAKPQPTREPGPVESPVTEGETFALPGERGFKPFQGRFFGRDLGSLLSRRGPGMAENMQTMLGEAMRRGDLARALSPGILGGGAGGGVSAAGGASLGDLLGPGAEENEFLRLIGGYGG